MKEGRWSGLAMSHGGSNLSRRGCRTTAFRRLLRLSLPVSSCQFQMMVWGWPRGGKVPLWRCILVLPPSDRGLVQGPPASCCSSGPLTGGLLLQPRMDKPTVTNSHMVLEFSSLMNPVCRRKTQFLYSEDDLIPTMTMPLQTLTEATNVIRMQIFWFRPKRREIQTWQWCIIVSLPPPLSPLSLRG